MDNRSPDVIGKIRGVLFDLDNTLYDRDLAFEMWARSFIEEHFTSEDEAQRADVLAKMVMLDDKGYRPKAAMFADLKTLCPTLPYDIDVCAPYSMSSGRLHMILSSNRRFQTCGFGYQPVAECEGISLEFPLAALAGTLLLFSENVLIVGLASCEQMVNDPSQFVSRRRIRGGRAETGTHFAVVVA